MFRVFYVSLCKWKNLCLLVYILKLSDLSVKMNYIPIKVLATDYESGNGECGLVLAGTLSLGEHHDPGPWRRLIPL